MKDKSKTTLLENLTKKNTEILKNTKRMYKSKFQLILCFNNVLKELKDSAIFA